MRRGQLHRLHRGVYAVGHRALTRHAIFLAAVKAGGGGAVLSHFSAAAHWELVDWDGRWPEITVIRGRTPRLRGIRVHRTTTLPDTDVAAEQGIPITSPMRTLVDVSMQLGYRRLRRAVAQAQSLRLLEVGQLTEDLRGRGPRPGTAKLRRIVAGGTAPTRSVLEDLVLKLIRDGGFTPPDVDVPLMIGARRVIPDFRWPTKRLVLEADGAAWHDHRIAREDDAERQALLEAHGERVIRVTWEQVVQRPGEVLERLRAAGAPNRPTSGREAHWAG